jgi:hypothetical protein
MTRNSPVRRTNRLSRRAFLAASATATGVVAGCLGDDENGEEDDGSGGNGDDDPSSPDVSPGRALLGHGDARQRRGRGGHVTPSAEARRG